MSHTTVTTPLLQSLLFSYDDVRHCLWRKPSERELAFLQYFESMKALLDPVEIKKLSRPHWKGRRGYDYLSILGILILKLFLHQDTMKATLLTLQENTNLQDILGITTVPSEATVSRLSSHVMNIVHLTMLHERLVRGYIHASDRVVGHLSIDSTIIEAREKPVKTAKSLRKKSEKKKRGRKRKGSVEEKELQERRQQEEQEKIRYLAESFEESMKRYELRCSITGKQNSKGKMQYFIGYKAHIATDDFGIPISYAVTGAKVHDSNLAVPLMKKAKQSTEFLYILLDKGYISPIINEYADIIERKVIIDKKSYKGVRPVPMDPATTHRYKSRTTVERTNSELKDGFLPNKIYRRGARARYEIELAILLTSMKKIRHVLTLYEKSEVS